MWGRVDRLRLELIRAAAAAAAAFEIGERRRTHLAPDYVERGGGFSQIVRLGVKCCPLLEQHR